MQLKPVLPVSIDLSSEEEKQKRLQRAARFNLDPSSDPLEKIQQQPNPAAELLRQKRQRAQQFGLEYKEEPQVPEGFPHIFHDESLKYFSQAVKGGRVPRNANTGDEESTFEIAAFDPAAARRWDTVHLFGTKMLVENMKTFDVLKWFADFGATCVEWISDYRCNVVFTDPPSARRCLLATSRFYAEDVAAAKNYLIEHNIKVDFAEQDLPFVVWREALGLNHKETSSLCMRIATVLDVKTDANRAKNSVYYQRNKAYFSRLVKERAARLSDAKIVQSAQEAEKIVTRTGEKSRLTLTPPSVPTMASSRLSRSSSHEQASSSGQSGESGGRKHYTGIFGLESATGASADDEKHSEEQRRVLRIVKPSQMGRKWERGHVIDYDDPRSRSGYSRISSRVRKVRIEPPEDYVPSGPRRKESREDWGRGAAGRAERLKKAADEVARTPQTEE